MTYIKSNSFSMISASSSFPLDECDKSVTDISFTLDLQGSIEDQKNFIADTEDYWMISTLYNVVKHNEQVEIKKISQHSEELANHSQQSQHQMSLNELFKFSQTNLNPIRPSGIHVVFIFISHSFFNATNFEFQDIRKQNYQSNTKLFLLAEDFIEGNNVYFAGSFRNLNFHEMYNLVCNKKCDASSLKYVNYDFKQAHLYVGPKLFHTLTYDESVLYCKKKFKNDLLYVETMDELKVQDGLKDCPNGEDEYLFRISDKICSGTLIVRGNVKKIDESVFPNLQADLKFNESISKELKIFQFETNFYNSSHALIPEKQILKFFGSLDFLEIKSSHCLLSTFKTSFRDWDLSKIVSIDMSYNKLSDITDLNLLSELRHLNLSHNPNFTFNDTSLFPNSLQVLDLSYTNVHSLPPNFFYALKNLKELFLKGTKITKFYDIKIPPYTLNILDLRGLTLSDIQSNYFKNLNITLQILSDDFRICCPSVLGDLNSLNRCKAPEDIISSCEHLVGNESKKILIWIIGFLTLFGNAFIVFYRLKKNQQTFNKPYDTLVLGLAISDGMIGIYLIIIASADVYFGEEYFQFHYHWLK
ncbi:hypothetical protein Btru_045569 [Bulinus truncatus]|nr:hypothetical protein Btru_045569 [Bulinus truncatus]